ncbi:hypothetical protein LCGC14_1796900 [marine sediment metagenome]|uniref:Uncharacterized protein n=1 Tax=marine sediment metagenome TaxID=412755 RepID=A0A0F9J5K6_9ZZZZ
MDPTTLKLIVGLVFQIFVIAVIIKVGLAKLQVKVEGMTADFKRIENKIDIINGRVDRHDTAIAVHEEKLDRLMTV